MLTLICGLPRAGKTTFSERFDDVIHLDTSGAYQGVVRRLRSREGDIVVEGVYGSTKDREALIRVYRGNEYRCIWLNTPDEVRRSRPGWSKWCDQPFEPPTYSEGWDEIVVIKGEDDG